MEALLSALVSVRFWHHGEVRFWLDADGVLHLRWGPEDRPRSASIGRPHPPDRLALLWTAPGGVLEGSGVTGHVAAALNLHLLDDTRERWGSGAAVAVFRFARCSAAEHRGSGGYRVLCPDCLLPIREAVAEGEERERAREAAEMLLEMSALERGGRR